MKTIVLHNGLPRSKTQGAECQGCINKEFDPFQCDACVNGSKFEGEDTTEELTYHEFIGFMRETE